VWPLISLDITAEKCTESALRESEERFAKVFQSNPAPIIISEIESGLLLDVNQRWLTMLEYSREEVIGRTAKEIGAWQNPEERECMVRELREKGFLRDYPVLLRAKSGKIRFTLRSTEIIVLNGKEVLVSLIYDDTDRQRTERTLRESEEKFSLAFDAGPDSININRLEDGLYVNVNKGFTEITGFTREDAIGRTSQEIEIWHDPTDRMRLLEDLKKNGNCDNLKAIFRKKDGSLLHGLMSARIISLNKTPHIISITRDITANVKLEAQYLEAQKMESVGRLTGGVAHDFNNILAVIMGYTEMAIGQTDPSQKVHTYLEKIYEAANRSADIIRQLLAFSRKQTIAPKVLDFNIAVEDMLKMLFRLIGENVDLVWVPAPVSLPVKMDPAQISQILLNLCVNARDAIEETGKLIIKTNTLIVDKEYCAVTDTPDIIPGKYVVLSVSDNGCGMEQDVIDKIFEPFFTTKGHFGTGLGLSTVYGIVKQNGGFINVDSQPRLGTTIKLYFQFHEGFPGESMLWRKGDGFDIPKNGQGETILLVEDDKDILNLSDIILKDLGYRVLKANSPYEALRLAKRCTHEIDLLITDVIMPEMNGKELSQQLLSQYPTLKLMYMSGYPGDVIARHGVINEKAHFLQKPFSSKELSVKVREILGDNRN